MTQVNLYEVTYWYMGNSSHADLVISVRAYTAADAVSQAELKLTRDFGKGNFMITSVGPKE